MYTGADLQNVCREAALIALRTRILGNGSFSKTSAPEAAGGQALADDSPSVEPVVRIS